MWFKAIKDLLCRENLYLGIDIGSSSIKAVVLLKLAGKIKLKSLAIIPLPQGVLKNKEAYAVDEFENALKALRKVIPKKIKKTVIAITGSQVITKIIQVDRSLTDIEVEYYLYGNLKLVTEKVAGEVNIDFVMLGNNKTDENLKDVFVVVAKKNLIDTRTAALKRSGFKTAVVDLETHAITRSLQLEFSLAKHNLTGVFAHLHIGEITSLFIVLIDGELVFSRELNIGVAQLINKAVIDKHPIDKDSNELDISVKNYKPLNSNFFEQGALNPTHLKSSLVDNTSVSHGTVDYNYVEKLIAQFRHCKQSYLAIFENQFIENWGCSGRGAHFPELITHLTNSLSVHINVCQPLHEIVALNSNVNIAKQNVMSVQGSFQVALGLAARGLN